MQRNQLAMGKVVAAGCVVGLTTALASPASAGTVAYWRFEDGPADSDITHLAGSDGVWSADVLDVSGGGNHLSTWKTGGNAGYQFKANVPASPVPQTGDTNVYSAKNTGPDPGMWNESLNTWSPTAWTIEVSFKIEAGGYRTIIGRDSIGGYTDGTDQNLAALYFQKNPDEALVLNFQDSAGHFHSAVSAANTIQGFDFGSDPEGDLVPWYSATGVSDGSTLSLYLMDQSVANPVYTLVAQVDMTLSGSTDTSLSTGHGDGGDWDAGNFTVGRGMYNGGHGDRAYGYIDEVRFSDMALSDSEFLFTPEPTTLALMGLGGVAMLRRR